MGRNSIYAAFYIVSHKKLATFIFIPSKKVEQISYFSQLNSGKDPKEKWELKLPPLLKSVAALPL